MTTSAQALAQLQAQQATNKTAGDYLTNENTALGVGDAQNTVEGLRTSIDNTTKLLSQVAPSVMGRTAGSLVTNAQATKQISNEQAPISKNLTTLGSQYGEANTNLSTLQSQAEKQAALDYQSQQDKNSYLQNLYNTIYTKEQDAAKQKEATRQYNATLAENKREANLSASKASSSGGSSGSSASTMEQALNQLGTSFKSGKGTARFYTDAKNYQTREQAAYSLANAAGVSYDEALKAIYARFKTAEGK